MPKRKAARSVVASSRIKSLAGRSACPFSPGEAARPNGSTLSGFFQHFAVPHFLHRLKEKASHPGCRQIPVVLFWCRKKRVPEAHGSTKSLLWMQDLDTASRGRVCRRLPRGSLRICV